MSTEEQRARRNVWKRRTRARKSGRPLPPLLPLPTEVERFWAKVERTEGCWRWGGAIDNGGYGRYAVRGVKNHLAHRYMYELVVGPIPSGLVIDHLCRNRRCVNPTHLEAVTTHVNNHRSTAPTILRSHATECPKGHPFDEANTGWEYPRGQPRRICRACRREYKRARYVPRKVA